MTLTEPKYHIAFDMDDTLCSFIDPVIDLAQKHFGTKFKLPGHGQYPDWFVQAMPNEETREAFLREHIFTEQFYANLEPLFGRHHDITLRSVSEAAWNHYKTVSIVTARRRVLGDQAERVTREWLRSRGFLRADEVEIHVVDGHHRKSEYLKPRSVMVDDAVHVAHDIEKTDHKMILVSHVWNSEVGRSCDRQVVHSYNMVSAIVQASETVVYG